MRKEKIGKGRMGMEMRKIRRSLWRRRRKFERRGLILCFL